MLFKFEGSPIKASCWCFIVLAYSFQVGSSQNTSTKVDPVVSTSISTTDISSFKDAIVTLPSDSSSSTREVGEHLQNMSRNSNITDKLKKCMAKGYHIIECFLLLNLEFHIPGYSLDFLQNVCSNPSNSASFVGQDRTTRSFTSDVEEFLLQRLPQLVLAMSALGIVCNLTTVVIILQNAKLRKPFFFGVSSLAIADVFYHVSFFLNKFLISSNACENVMFQKIIYVTTFATKTYSSLNLVLLLTLRYVMFVDPLRSRVYLTNRRVAVLSCLSLILSTVYGLLIVELLWSLYVPYLHFLYIADDGLLLAVVVSFNIYFLVNRCKTLKSSLAARNLKKQMILAVLLILLLRTTDSVFSIIRSILRDRIMITGPFLNSSFNEDYMFSNVSDVFKIIVHAVNPFIYFFTSGNVFKLLFSCLPCHNE